MTITIEEIVQQMDDWKNTKVEIYEMTGGLTNRNFRVSVDDKAFFVRVPGADTELLAIDRDNEYHSSKAAADAGIGPKVFYHLPDHIVIVMEFLIGRTMSIETLNAAGLPTRIAQSRKKLHSGANCVYDFVMLRVVVF